MDQEDRARRIGFAPEECFLVSDVNLHALVIRGTVYASEKVKLRQGWSFSRDDPFLRVNRRQVPVKQC